MYLISAFRRATLAGNVPGHIRRTPMTAEVSRTRIDRPEEPRENGGERPALTCHWEVAEDQTVQLEGQTFRCGDMFMHWMPVH